MADEPVSVHSASARSAWVSCMKRKAWPARAPVTGAKPKTPTSVLGPKGGAKSWYA